MPKYENEKNIQKKKKKKERNTLNITVIVMVNEPPTLSSNPRRNCLRFTSHNNFGKA